MNTVILLVGSSYTRKEKFAANYISKHTHYELIDIQRARDIYAKGSSDIAVQVVYNHLFLLLTKHLENNHNVIINAPFLYAGEREEFIKLARKHNTHITAIIFNENRNTNLEKVSKTKENIDQIIRI